MNNTTKRLLAALAALLLLGIPAQAQITLVTSRPALAGTDFIDWGNLGAEFTTVASPFNTLSNLGLAVTGSEQFSLFQRLNQGSGYFGNFAPGNRLLYTGNDTVGGGGPITLSFANTLSAFGLQIQSNDLGAFTARLTFRDAGNVSVGTVTLAGTSNTNGDNSAIFIGGVSGSPATNFVSVIISLDAAPSNGVTDFVVNQADFVAVPEPAGVVLVGTALAGSLGYLWRWRRRRQEADPTIE